MLNKVCTKCHKRFSHDNFVKDPSKKDGLYSSCKDCYRERIGCEKRPDWHGKIVLINGIQCRWCEGCRENKDCDLFYTRKNSRADTRCKECVIKMRSTEHYRLQDKKRREKLRSDVINHYSNGKNCCKCCGETEIKFLSLDHINGGGNRHRHEMGTRGLYGVLRRDGYPKGFQILCHNCNLAKGFYGVCPHETNK